VEEIKKMQSELHILVNVLSGRAVWPAGLLENGDDKYENK